MSVKNLKPTMAYLKPKQIKDLKELKETIKNEHGVTLSLSELMRGAIDDFISTNKEDVKPYLEYLGF
jgi:hypothetical protein